MLKLSNNFKVYDVKIWNDLPKNIRDKAMILSDKSFSKLLKKTVFYNSNNVLTYNMYGM